MAEFGQGVFAITVGGQGGVLNTGDTMVHKIDTGRFLLEAYSLVKKTDTKHNNNKVWWKWYCKISKSVLCGILTPSGEGVVTFLGEG